jgi:hypothetical protein
MFGQSLKLFVDDMRQCPEGWTPAKTVTEAIRILATQEVEEVSLDHDIATPYRMHLSTPSFSDETFFPVAYYIATMEFKPRVRIHTANFTRGREMANLLGIEYDCYIYNPEDYNIEEKFEG